MRNIPWTIVLGWLGGQTGLAVTISHPKPTGTISFLSSGKAVYTLSQVIDILNGELSKQKLKLVRRAKAFTIEQISAAGASNQGKESPCSSADSPSPTR
jgi:hypothetical protein